MSRTLPPPTSRTEPPSGPIEPPRPLGLRHPIDDDRNLARAGEAVPPRRGPRAALVVALVLSVAAAGGVGWWWARPVPDRVDITRYHAAVAAEDGVRPLVSDRVGELGEIIAVTVRRTADPDLARIHLLAPIGEERPRLSVLSHPEPGDLAVHGRFADGRPYEIHETTTEYSSLSTVGDDGQFVEMMGREVPDDDLVALAAQVHVGFTGLVAVPDGWVERGVNPMPPWHDGFTTSYDLAGGRRLDITSERRAPGRQTLAAFGSTEPVEIGLGGWAYRYLPPAAGLLFERGDVVVSLTGSFSEAELVQVAHTLREMRPDEHPLADPFPFPPS